MLDVLANFRVADAVDIAIIAFVIYRIIDLIRGTRAVQMLIGLMVVFLTFLSSRYFDLYTLNWIFDNFLSSILLVIVVIFQDDIRRALTQFGTRPFFGSEPGIQGQDLEEIVRAAVALASQAHRCADRLAARGWPERVRRGRHPSRRARQQGADHQHLHPTRPDPRRRGDHP